MHKPIIDRPHPTGMGRFQKVYRFDNGYGASVVKFPGSYGYDRGLLELAVVKFKGEGDGYALTYETPITSDVEGNLSADDVERLLDQISALPAPEHHPQVSA